MEPAAIKCLTPELDYSVGLWPVACGLWPVACGLWPVACGLWPVACGLWPVACGLWLVTADEGRIHKKSSGGFFRFFLDYAKSDRFLTRKK
jgi:hypothetical protein